MIYPYTQISVKDAEMTYNTLISFGYDPKYFIYNFFNLKEIFRDFDQMLVVIDDCGDFGNFCFYPKGALDENIERDFVNDKFEFLKIAAKLKNVNEF